MPVTTAGRSTPFYTRSSRAPAGPMSGLLSASALARPRGLVAWVRLHRALCASLAVVVTVSVAVGAALLIRQDVTTNPTANTPPVIFQNGADYVSINAAGFATITLGSSGTSATLAISGVPGAASVSLGDVLKIKNQDATADFVVTLTRSGAVDADITTFSMDIDDGATDVETWNVLGGSATTPYTLVHGHTLDLGISLVMAAGITGAQGSFTIQVSIAPA